jgi:hypothetical protein
MGAQLPGDAVRIAFRSRDRPGVLSEQGFCSVALQAGGGERDGAVVAAAVGPDGVGLLPAAKAIGHPPEPRAGLARPIQVRRDQEIETTASRVGNLRGTHSPFSSFGRAARQSTSVLICRGLACLSSLRAICFELASCSEHRNLSRTFVLSIPTKIPTNRVAGSEREQTVMNTDVREIAHFSRGCAHLPERYRTPQDCLEQAPFLPPR